jgi:hypothetical protein
MTRGKARLACGCAAVAWVLGVTAARAEGCTPPKPGSWSVDQVEAAFDAGVAQLETARGATAAARADLAKLAETQFRTVEARYPCLPENVLHLAESLELQGKYLDAMQQYDRLLGSRITLSKSPFWKGSIGTAEKAAQELSGRIPAVVVRLEKNGRCGAASATIAPTEEQDHRHRIEFDAWLSVDPGEYSVMATAGGCEDFKERVTVVAGERREISVKLAPPPPPPPIDPLHRKPPKCLGMPTWVCWVGGGVLVAGATAGTILLLKPSEAAQPAPTCPASIQTIGCTYLQ